jgi:hypothetical protein
VIAGVRGSYHLTSVRHCVCSPARRMAAGNRSYRPTARLRDRPSVSFQGRQASSGSPTTKIAPASPPSGPRHPTHYRVWIDPEASVEEVGSRHLIGRG